jgi:hypothetical protein
LGTAVERLDDMNNAWIDLDGKVLAVMFDIKVDRAVVQGAGYCHRIAFKSMLATRLGSKEPDVGRCKCFAKVPLVMFCPLVVDFRWF